MQRKPRTFRILQTSVVGFAVFAAMLGTFNPPRAYAVAGIGDIVHDPINYLVNGITSASTQGLNIKEYVLKPLAWSVAKIAIQSITTSTVNWINSGFQGSPAFVTDLQAHMGVVADTVAAQFFTQLANNISVKSPFGDGVTQSLKDAYYKASSANSYFQYAYSLSQHSSDPVAFTRGNFNQGGFSAWFAAQKCENNSLCTYIKASNELSSRISSAQDVQRTMLNWGGGIRSYTKCDASGPPANQATSLSFSNINKCLGSTVVTPGSIIAARANKVFGASQDQLVTANEIDAVLGALVGQMVNGILGGSGLLGLSSPSAGGGPSTLSQAATLSQATPTGLSRQFTSTITGQETAIKTFQSNWQTIQSAANQAKTCSTDPSIQATLDTAAAELAKAASALSQLDALSAQAQASQDTSSTGTTGALVTVADTYSQIVNSTTLPSPTELSDATVQALDAPASLYGKMKALAQTCGHT